MARTHARPQADRELTLHCCQDRCWDCGGPCGWPTTITAPSPPSTGCTPDAPGAPLPDSGLSRYRQPYRPEEEGH